MRSWEADKAKAGRNGGKNKVVADGQQGMLPPVPPWVSGTAELNLLLPEGVRRNEPMAFDQSGGIVAIAERSPCACRAMYHKTGFLLRLFLICSARRATTPVVSVC